MNKKMKLTLVAAAMSMSFAATAGTVDLFSTDQAKLSDTTAADGGLSSSVTGAGILGGERDLFVELLTISSSNPGATADLGVAGGALSFSVDSLATGMAIVQWDGVDGSIALNYTGLGNYDLTADGSTAFQIDTLFSDLGYRFDIEAYTDSTTWTKISFLAHAVSSPTTSYASFAGFTNALLCGYSGDGSGGSLIPGVTSITCGGGGNVNFANLGALQVLIDPLGGTTSVDLTLDSVKTIPEPGMLALLGVGLLGLGAMTRRRKQVS